MRWYQHKLSNSPCNALDFNKNVLWKTRNLHCRSCWSMVSKEFGINSIYNNEVVHRLQENLVYALMRSEFVAPIPDISETYCSFRDLAQLRAASFHNCLEIPQGLFCLSLDPTFDDLHSWRHKRDASRAEQQISYFDCLWIRPNGSRCLWNEGSVIISQEMNRGTNVLWKQRTGFHVLRWEQPLWW